MAKSLRWAVSLQNTLHLPNFEELFRKAILSLPEEDVKSQRAFKYKQDSLACLIGRILARKASSDCLKMAWREIDIDRSSKGKPYLKNNPNTNFHFNISHHGDLVVLVTETVPIGVDVMRIEKRSSETTEEHIRKLKRQFTEQETLMMLSYTTEFERWRAFYRVWCLKEAILKATGIGLTDDLKKYDFVTKPADSFQPGCFITSTKYFHENVEQKTWNIEESFIGENHCVGVAYEKISDSRQNHSFELINFGELLEDAQFMSPDLDDIEEFEEFDKKRDKHF